MTKARKLVNGGGEIHARVGPTTPPLTQCPPFADDLLLLVLALSFSMSAEKFIRRIKKTVPGI